MPLFEYSCEKCGERFEALVPRAEADRAVCPKCGSRRVRRELSTFAAVGGRSEFACASGTCPGTGSLGSCATGTCPFSAR